MDLNAEDLIDMMNVVKFYYGCNSVSKVGEVHGNE
jgi:hypothetical protein